MRYVYQGTVFGCLRIFSAWIWYIAWPRPAYSSLARLLLIILIRVTTSTYLCMFWLISSIILFLCRTISLLQLQSHGYSALLLCLPENHRDVHMRIVNWKSVVLYHSTAMEYWFTKNGDNFLHRSSVVQFSLNRLVMLISPTYLSFAVISVSLFSRSIPSNTRHSVVVV